MKNIVSCDKCATIGHLIHDSSDQRNDPTWLLPEGWNVIGGIDLCKQCSKSFEEWLGKKPSLITWV